MPQGYIFASKLLNPWHDHSPKTHTTTQFLLLTLGPNPCRKWHSPFPPHQTPSFTTQGAGHTIDHFHGETPGQSSSTYIACTEKFRPHPNQSPPPFPILSPIQAIKSALANIIRQRHGAQYAGYCCPSYR